MTGFDCDLLVIGSGPAGESAAINAAKRGQRTVVVDESEWVGGACTHRGTIPSKALRHMVRQVMRFNSNPIFRDIGDPRTISFERLLAHTEEVVRKQVRMRSKFYYRNGVDVRHARAAFVDPHTLDLFYNDGARDRISAESIVIASGSRPYHPPEIDFSHPRVRDSDSILDLKDTPRKVLIYGAGVIGCEYASIFSGLGVKIELVNTRDRLLEFLDDEISDALSYQLRDHGVMVRHREEFRGLESSAEGVVLSLASGKRLHGDILLWCNGRTGNTDSLNLAAAGLSANSRGQLEVDAHYQTAVPHIFAAGDVIGWPSLASAAYDQGRSAAASARGKEHCRFVDDVPTGIYTIPEISSVGRNERELTEARVPYEVGRAFFKDTARGQISGDDVGMLKILFHAETLAILGIHCFGGEAAEIIHIGQAIMKQPGAGNTLRYFITTTFNYPTMAEAYSTAALNGLNRL